ncbi:MAG: hypothetical protein GPOALKHO_000172 [Sodalis sp.]|nr:MAG: hypothetical protein GPOALKHO_000172 [Sodalis sp.]
MSRVLPLLFHGAVATPEQNTQPVALETEHLRVRYGTTCPRQCIAPPAVASCFHRSPPGPRPAERMGYSPRKPPPIKYADRMYLGLLNKGSSALT